MYIVNQSQIVLNKIASLDALNYSVDDLDSIRAEIQSYLHVLNTLTLNTLSDSDKEVILNVLLKSALHLHKFHSYEQSWADCLYYARKLNYKQEAVSTVTVVIEASEQGSVI